MRLRSVSLCLGLLLVPSAQTASAEIKPVQSKSGQTPSTKATLSRDATAKADPGPPARTSDAPTAIAAPSPWFDRALPPERRARLVLAAMTLDEKIAFVQTRFGVPFQGRPKPEGALDSAGYSPGIPRLGIPPLQETDAGLGIANPTNAKVDATPLPSGLAIGATFDPALARAGGAMIGAEARARGFTMVLGGGADLTRDPLDGRNFEYMGEDPLLTGVMAGAMVAGIQSQGVMSTVKHYALNAQENGRFILSADIAEAPARESDLLAFEIALERGAPASVMASYNRVNGEYASENTFLLNDVLKRDWRFSGWVMSDWGGTHSTEKAVLAGLDQESGENLDPAPMLADPLRAAIAAGRVPMARLDDMVARILTAEFRVGVIDNPPKPGGGVDMAKHAVVAADIARDGVVLLKNDGARLPLVAASLRHILVIGEHADFGVLSGGGSSQVVPFGALRMEGDPPGKFYGKPKLYDPSSPLRAIQHEAPNAAVAFQDGQDPGAAATAAKDADVVILFAEQWMNEGRDAPSLALPKKQDDLIAQVAAANPNTIVVLETGGPVTMPWLSSVPAVLEAWYSGARGGDVIAAMLFGRLAPSGRLPITFPRDLGQLPRPDIRDPELSSLSPNEPSKGPPFSVDYGIEGADVGYKWFARTHKAPLFPFGYGLSYTRFSYGTPTVTARRGAVSVSLDVTNVGDHEGTDTPQVYLDSAYFTRRLGGWDRVTLKTGETKRVSISIDPRIFATFDTKRHCWRINKGRYTVSALTDAAGSGSRAPPITLTARDLPP